MNCEIERFIARATTKKTERGKMKRILLLLILTSNLTCYSQTQAEMNKEQSIGHKTANIELNKSHYTKAYIEKDSTIWIPQNISSEIKIFGYQSKDTLSTKMILLSAYTNDVENNPYKCKYGAYYHTQSMDDLELKYLSTENQFMKIAILKKGKLIDTVFMKKKFFEFSEE